MVYTQPKIIVIIATKNRTKLLKARSLKSVYDQEVLPYQIIVVDDSDNQKAINENMVVIEEYKNKVSTTQITHIFNQRTKGAAGSWNSAVDFILSEQQIPENVFIAILDDDDEWHSDYIKLCTEYIQQYSLDMVACDFYRITEEDTIINTAPDTLLVNDFLVGNPGIQGSNIFIRLSYFLEAGCFDENIQSSTDRDLCIRISDLGTVQYKRITTPLMRHFAESTRIRMSKPNAEIKNSGLYNFWLKHSKRMDAKTKETYLKRVKNLFDWELPKTKYFEKEEKHFANATSEAFSLQVGIICSSYDVISPLLPQLERLEDEIFINKIQVFLLENNLSIEDKNAIVNQNNTLDLVFITTEMQDKWIENIDYFRAFSRNKDNNMFSIAQARTLLQKYIGQVIEKAQNPDSFIAWILDEDMQLTVNTIEGLKNLPEFKKRGVDIVIGKFDHASPNPPINGIRTQLVDFWYNLNWLLNQNKNDIVQDISFENKALMTKYPDYYYDLSRKHSGHLEHPFWYKPNLDLVTVEVQIERLCKEAIQIFGGTPLTRPLLILRDTNIIDTAKDSVNRGGNTFIFNSKALSSVPNLNIEIKGTDIRRSDMMWAIVNKHYRKMNIKMANIPTWHAGKAIQRPISLNIDKVREEILGSCLYAGLTDFLKLTPSHSLHFTKTDITTIIQNIKKHLRQRMILLKYSFYRARGISKNIQNSTIYAENRDLQELTKIVNTFFSQQNFGLIEKNVDIISFSELSNFLNSMQTQSDNYKNITL